MLIQQAFGHVPEPLHHLLVLTGFGCLSDLTVVQIGSTLDARLQARHHRRGSPFLDRLCGYGELSPPKWEPRKEQLDELGKLGMPLEVCLNAPSV